MNINNVNTFWSNIPCNINHSNKTIYSKEYFEEVTKKRNECIFNLLDLKNEGELDIVTLM